MNQDSISRHRLRSLLGVVIATTVIAVTVCAVGESADRGQSGVSTWDGVYTEAQAKEGENAFFSHCAECHGQDLEGREQAPALAGLGFMDKWNRAMLRKLFEAVEQMPPDNPKTLTPQQYVDVLAYLLHANGFPAGTAALTTDRPALGRIEIRNVRPTK